MVELFDIVWLYWLNSDLFKKLELYVTSTEVSTLLHYFFYSTIVAEK